MWQQGSHNLQFTSGHPGILFSEVPVGASDVPLWETVVASDFGPINMASKFLDQNHEERIKSEMSVRWIIKWQMPMDVWD